MVEQDELELELSRLYNLWGMGNDFHTLFRRSETGWQELWFSFLLDDAKTASAEGNKPSIMAESGNADTTRLSSLKDGFSFLNLYSDVVDLHFDDLLGHDSIKFLGVMEYWSTGVLGLILVGSFVFMLLHHSINPSLQHSTISSIQSL
jgi:hypothetical protein